MVKLLDQKFKKTSEDIYSVQKDETSEFGFQVPPEVKNLLDLIHQRAGGVSKIMEKPLKSENRSSLPNSPRKISKNEELNVKNLCKFLTGEEIEIVLKTFILRFFNRIV